MFPLFSLLLLGAKTFADDTSNWKIIDPYSVEHKYFGRKLTYDRPACAADIEIFTVVDKDCPRFDSKLPVEEQSGVLILRQWIEGTGSWTNFKDFDATHEIEFAEEGQHLINVCFYSTEYLAFKSFTIGDKHLSPSGEDAVTIDAVDYLSYVDVDLTSNGLPTLVDGDAIGYIHSGESLQFPITVNKKGWYPISYQLSRSCEDQCDHEQPKQCNNGGTVCGNEKTCCGEKERCYITNNVSYRELTSGSVTRGLHTSGTCCPLTRSCHTECCAEGEMCMDGQCKVYKEDPNTPTCQPDEFSCSYNACCPYGNACYIEGMSGPLFGRSLRSTEGRMLTEGSCCPAERSCPLKCCPDDQTCVDGSCKRNDCPVHRTCGEDCCNEGFICSGIVCEIEKAPSPAPTEAPVSYGVPDRKLVDEEKGLKYFI